MAPHSSTLAWKIPWAEQPGRLQSMGSLGAGHDWATSLSLFTFMHWRRKWQPTPVFLPGESQGRGSLVGCRLWGHTEWTRLKRLSSSSSVGDLGSIPGLGRSPGEGKGYPLQYCGLENSMDCIVHGVTNSWTHLSNFHSLTFCISFHSIFMLIIYVLNTLSLILNKYVSLSNL